MALVQTDLVERIQQLLKTWAAQIKGTNTGTTLRKTVLFVCSAWLFLERSTEMALALCWKLFWMELFMCFIKWLRTGEAERCKGASWGAYVGPCMGLGAKYSWMKIFESCFQLPALSCMHATDFSWDWQQAALMSVQKWRPVCDFSLFAKDTKCSTQSVLVLIKRLYVNERVFFK